MIDQEDLLKEDNKPHAFSHHEIIEEIFSPSIDVRFGHSLDHILLPLRQRKLGECQLVPAYIMKVSDSKLNYAIVSSQASSQLPGSD